MTDNNLTEALDFLGYLDKAIAEKGEDYVYHPNRQPDPDDPDEFMQMCEYVHIEEVDGEEVMSAACLVGHALAAMGVPLEKINRHEGTGASDVLAALGAVTSQDVREAAREAQRQQDMGAPWGEARQAYVNVIRQEYPTFNG